MAATETARDVTRPRRGAADRTGIRHMVVATLMVPLGVGCSAASPSAGSARTPTKAAPAAAPTTAPWPGDAAAAWVVVKTADAFQQHVIRSAGPVLVEFVLPLCAGCRQMAPMLERLMGEYRGKVTFAEVDMTDVADLADTYRIPRAPAVLLFVKGKEFGRLLGVSSEGQVRSALDAALSR